MGEESRLKNILIANTTGYIRLRSYGVNFCDGIHLTECTPWVEEEDIRGFLSGDGEVPIIDWIEVVKSMGFDGTYSS